MGKFSRRKGIRHEYGVRDLVRKEGMQAHRVPASGAAQGFKGDIQVEHNGRKFTLEVKARKDQFSRIYSAYDSLNVDGKLNFFLGDKPDALCVSITDTLSKQLENNAHYKPGSAFPAEHIAGLVQASRTKKMLGTSDFLVLHVDRKPYLFVSFK